MNRLSRSLLQSFTGLAIAVAIVLPASAATPANHLVISQVQTAGLGIGGMTDEFIELYNPTDKPISLAGWSLQYKAANIAYSGVIVQPLPADAMIAAYSYYLARPIGQPQAADTNYTGFWLDELAGNVFLANSVTQVSAMTDVTIVDRLGYGATGDAAETNPATAPTIGQSLERQPGADLGEGNAIDTDNNAVDWALRSTPKPRLTTSPFERSAAPIVSNLMPLHDSYSLSTNVTISATAFDGNGSGIATSGIELWIDGAKIGTASYDPTTGQVLIPVTLGQGTHTAKLSVTDKAGYSTVQVTLFTVDSIAPLASLEINSAGTRTNSRWVSISPIINEGPDGVASGLKEMQVSLDGTLDTEAWEPYSSSFSRELPDGEGLKTVMIRVRDRAGNMSNAASAVVEYAKNAFMAPVEPISTTTLLPNGYKVLVTWTPSPRAVSYLVRYTDGTVLYGPFATTANNFTFEGLDKTKNYRFEVASVGIGGTISEFGKVMPPVKKTATVAVTSSEELPTGGPVDETPAFTDRSNVQVSPTPAVTVSPSPSATPDVEGATDSQPRDWTRIIVALSLLIIAAGLATGGWYLYQWWTSRPTDKGKGGRW